MVLERITPLPITPIHDRVCFGADQNARGVLSHPNIVREVSNNPLLNMPLNDNDEHSRIRTLRIFRRTIDRAIEDEETGLRIKALKNSDTEVVKKPEISLMKGTACLAALIVIVAGLYIGVGYAVNPEFGSLLSHRFGF